MILYFTVIFGLALVNTVRLIADITQLKHERVAYDIFHRRLFYVFFINWILLAYSWMEYIHTHTEIIE